MGSDLPTEQMDCESRTRTLLPTRGNMNCTRRPGITLRESPPEKVLLLYLLCEWISFTKEMDIKRFFVLTWETHF